MLRRKSTNKFNKKKNKIKHKYELIIFDIDNTLFDSLNKDEEANSPDKFKPDHKLRHGGQDFKMYARPYLTEFINFCKKNFKHIALWTHADKLWLQKFIDNILPSDTQLLFKYHNKHGEDKGPYKLKPLKKIYSEFPQYNEHNTLIIEDTEDNCRDNLKNCIIVPEFSIIKHHTQPDIVLPLLAKYLSKLQTGEISHIERKKWYTNELKNFILQNKHKNITRRKSISKK